MIDLVIIVALYFSCCDNLDTFVEIIAFDKSIFEGKYYNSDILSILLSLSLLNEKLINEIFENADIEIGKFRELDTIKKLYYYVSQERNNFSNQLEYNSLSTLTLYYACKNNQRIIKQDGLFYAD